MVKSDMSRIDMNLFKLEQISRLVKNWNGNSADPFQRELIDKSINILNTLDVQPHLSPTANNSIQFEYNKDNGGYLEFEIFSDRIEVWEMIPNRIDKQFIIKHNDIHKLNDIVTSFYDKE